MAKRSQGFAPSLDFCFFIIWKEKRYLFFSTTANVERPECVPAPSQQTISLLLKWIHYIWRSGLIFNLEHVGKKKKKEKKSIRVHLSCISHSIVGLQWDLFSSGRFNTWAGQWKERNGVGWGWGGEGGGIVQRRAGRNGREGRSNSYLKRAYPSSFLDFIIRYVWDNSVEWNKVILPPQKAESPWSSPSALTWFQSERFSDGAAGM